MRSIIYILLALVAFSACSSKTNEEQKADIAGQTAKNYYEYLINGKYKDFVAGMAGTDSIENDYRQQLLENTAMYVGQLKKEHKGIIKIEKQASKVDEKNHTAEAFLTMYFADSTHEEIVVPLIEKNGVWYMR